MKAGVDEEKGTRAQIALTVVCWVTVVPFALWAAVRLFGLEARYPWVKLIAFTPYVLGLALVALLVVVLLRRWAPSAVAALAVVVLAVSVLPRALGGPDEPVTGGRTMSLIAFNLAKGKADLNQLLKISRDREVDLLSLQEVTPAAAVGFREAGFRRVFPYAVVKTSPDAGGAALFSRFPIIYAGRPATRAIQPRAIVRAPDTVLFELMSVHPNAPAGPITTPQWESDFELLPSAGVTGPPLVLAGDFNATLDHRNLRDLIGTGYRDAGDVTGSGLVPTWPSKLKWPLPVTIDHVLVEPPLRITGYVVIAIRGSDHRAVLTGLSVPPG